jgi:malonate transporter and related proteins
MSGVAEIVLSIFGLIGIGYLAVRSRLLAGDAAEGLSSFVFTVAIPVLLFRTLAAADLKGVAPWGLWAAYFAAAATVWALADILIRRVFSRGARAGIVAGVSAAYANVVMVGISLVEAAYGDAGLVWLLVIVSVHLPVMMAASVALHERALRVDGVAAAAGGLVAAARRLASGLLRNLIILGILAGAAWRILGLPLSGVPAQLVESLSQVAGPLALVACGMSLAGQNLSGTLAPALATSALKLFVLPALVLAAGTLLGLPPLALAVATLTAACPTGVNAYLIAVRLSTDEALASNSITISTALGTVTVGLWLAAIHRLVG